MKTLVFIAIRQLLDRKRQSLVSFMGIVLGVGFFLAISSLMQGSQNDFIKRLIDNSPHINIVDEFRNPRVQAVEKFYSGNVVQISSVKPLRETRGIRGYNKILSYLYEIPDVRSSPVLLGQGIVSFSGQDAPVTLNGMIPEDISSVSTIVEYLIEGRIENLYGNNGAIIVGSELLKKLALSMGDTVSVTVNADGKTRFRTYKIEGVFRTGRSSYDSAQAFVTIRSAQSLLNRPNRVNSIILKISDPEEAQELAASIEKKFSYKSISWQETSEDIMSTLSIRNTIMYTVVSAVLVVAAFGIYNVISTVVMEKYRDIAILKSMGFYPRDVRFIFAIQGGILGLMGCVIGLPFGAILMYVMSLVTFKPPGASTTVTLPIDWTYPQFLLAASFALIAAFAAAYLPARKAGSIQPVDILRGGAW